jgi:hypothetical protein
VGLRARKRRCHLCEGVLTPYKAFGQKGCLKSVPSGADSKQSPFDKERGPVAGLVGIEGGVVSGSINLESLGVRAPSGRPRPGNRYYEA